MQEKDIIITAFSCGGKMKCKKEAEKFEFPTMVLSVPGGTEDGFVKTAKSFRKNNSILDSFLESKLKKVKPRRVCLVSFDVGWAWIAQVLRTKKDPQRIDSIIVMDGIHSSGLKSWINYARLASNERLGGPRLWMAHTQIKPQKGVSAKTTNSKIFKEAIAEKSFAEKIRFDQIPLNISSNKFDRPIIIYSKNEIPKRKIYHSDPLHKIDICGNLVRLEYKGSKAQDHIYNAQYVQPRLWEWLQGVWLADTGVFFK